MADSYLFPVFDMPGEDSEEAVEEKYSPSVYFDFEKGDFARDGANRMVVASGQEAFMQWCVKTLHTEREQLLAYGEDHGVEFDALHELSDPGQIESEIEKTITEALQENPSCESVSNFSFEHIGDTVKVSFMVKGYEWDEELLTMTLPER